jgi:hypothetical protein
MNGNPGSSSAAESPTVLSLDLAVAGVGGSAPPAWPLWQRIVFRYLLLHYVLYAFPRPLNLLLSLVSSGLEAVGLDVTQSPWRLPGKWVMELGKVDTWWQALTTWMSELGLVPYEVIHQPTGSGDTAHDIARLLAIVAAAALLTLLWSLLPWGSRGHPRLGRWLHVLVRFDLAFWLLGYGAAKLYGGQFGDLGLMRLTQEIGDTTPMGMVGTFMQASKPYELFGGGGEVLGGLLLFHRRTALLGACVSIAVMINVCALNWLYGVPVKLFSLHLLLYGVFLLAPYRARLWALFVSNRASLPVDLRVVQSKWASWPLLALGTLWVAGTLVEGHISGMAPRPWMVGMEKSALYGVWTVDKMLLDGQEVPVSDATRWRYFAVDRGTLAWAREASGQRRFFDFVWDEPTGGAQVKVRGAAAEVGPAPWTCERGTKTVPVDVPLLLKNEDRGRKIDGERRTLLLKGQWGDRQLELHTVEKVFRLQTGFRLRQELPDGW